MKRLAILLLCSLPLAGSCDSHRLDLPEYEEKLVVEGWIENGQAPMVSVMTSLPVSSDPKPLADIYTHAVNYAEVSINVDGKEYFLTSSLDDEMTLNNYYTSSLLKGETGKTYMLKVKYDDYEASATCTIPEDPVIISSKTTSDGASYSTAVIIRNDDSYCKAFIRENGASVFSDAISRVVSGEGAGNEISVEISHESSDSVIKIASMEKSLYDFWMAFQSVAGLTSNENFPTYRNLSGNVQGALGYWAGYGVSLVETSYTDK